MVAVCLFQLLVVEHFFGFSLSLQRSRITEFWFLIVRPEVRRDLYINRLRRERLSLNHIVSYASIKFRLFLIFGILDQYLIKQHSHVGSVTRL